MSGYREKYVDFAKGVAIFLVVLGHIIDKESFAHTFSTISSFHMPLFFFLSGIAMNFTKIDTPRYLLRKIVNLLLPFFVIGGVYATFAKGGVMFSAYWYLPVLFVFSIIVFINKYFWERNKLICVLLDLLFTIVIVLTLLKCNIRFVYSLSFYTIAYIVPFLAGTFYPSFKDRIPNIIYLLCLLSVFLLTPYFSGFVHHSVYMHLLKNVIGISMTLLLLALFQNINYVNNKFAELLCFIGRNTMSIYLFHFFLLTTYSEHGEIIDTFVNAIIAIPIIAISIIIGKMVSISSFASFFILGKIPERLKRFFY